MCETWVQASALQRKEGREEGRKKGRKEGREGGRKEDI
jgi:hypothetical protein